MPEQPVTASALVELIEGEALNLQEAREMFGTSLRTVNEVDALYSTLATSVETFRRKSAFDSPEAHGCVVLLFMQSRIQLPLGVVAVLRRHWADSLMHLRKATEACAIAARIQKHPHLASVWAEATKDTVHYGKFQEKFKRLFPPEDALLQQAFESYDYSSKIIHGSPLSLKDHVSVSRPSPLSLHVDSNSFDIRYKAQLVAGIYYHLIAHIAVIRVFERTFGRGDSTTNDAFDKALTSLQERLESQNQEWVAAYPDKGGW
jgi:hypothetical protein